MGWPIRDVVAGRLRLLGGFVKLLLQFAVVWGVGGGLGSGEKEQSHPGWVLSNRIGLILDLILDSSLGDASQQKGICVPIK